MLHLQFVLCYGFCAVQAEAELKRLGQVYAVYSEHADNVRQYSQQLWADLDITRMVTGTDEVAKKLRALTALKNLPVYETVEKEIQGFKNSLPMMRDLKNDALRKRHWDQLMVVTGDTAVCPLHMLQMSAHFLLCIQVFVWLLFVYQMVHFKLF